MTIYGMGLGWGERSGLWEPRGRAANRTALRRLPDSTLQPKSAGGTGITQEEQARVGAGPQQRDGLVAWQPRD